MRITIVGCGSIGTRLAEAADEMPEVKRIYLTDIERPLAEKLAARLKKAIVVEDVEEDLYHCDLVIEAASQDAAKDIAPRVVSRGVDIMIMSVGAFVDDEFRESVKEKANQAEAKVYVPSGAICGTDGLRSASVGRLDEVELITTKGPKSLEGVPYIVEHGIDVDKVKEPTVVFTGTARDAVRLFPRNVNVAATVSLLGLGFDKTRVKIVLDPASKSNSHELRIKGEFGEMTCHTYNVPSPDNPSTSYLASLSAISAMDRAVSNTWIGIRRHCFLPPRVSPRMQGTRAERLIGNAEGMDAVVVANDGEPFLDSTFWYLTEQNSGTFEGCFAVVGPGGSLDVIVSTLEAEGAAAGRGEVHVFSDGKERDELIRKALKGCSKVGFNYNSVTYAAAEYVKRVAGVEAVNAAKAIGETVSVKDEKEIASTRRACAISSQVAGEIPGMLSEGVSEREVAARMDARMRELGGTGNAFDTIAAFGAWSSQPHHMPCDYKLKKGDAALFDFGTKYEGYCSDMTRTVFLGKPEEILERAYDVVLKAQRAGIAEYRAGAPANAADLAARAVIDESEFEGKFIHSFGHGIGMDIHQHISVSPRSDQVLKAGNVVSAEPGVYIPGVGGIRIEDTVLITEDGCEVLTSFDHSLTVVRWSWNSRRRSRRRTCCTRRSTGCSRSGRSSPTPGRRRSARPGPPR